MYVLVLCKLLNSIKNVTFVIMVMIETDGSAKGKRREVMNVQSYNI